LLYEKKLDESLAELRRAEDLDPHDAGTMPVRTRLSRKRCRPRV